jgi:hypothetical protein
MQKHWKLLALALTVSGVFLFFPILQAEAAVNCSDPGVICVSGDLPGNETWTSANIYVITADLTVPAGVTLTIEAGTIIKFNVYHVELFVDGVLNTNGASGNRVYFTSVNDDSLGGDTNHDTAPPGADQWGRVYFRGGSSGALNYVEMRYGGNYSGMLYMDGGASVTVDHGVFKNSGDCAISSDPGYEPTLTNMSPEDFTGSVFNGICMRSLPIANNATWDETEAAYILYNDITVVSGYTLALGPGVVIKPRGYYAELIVDGILNANGTSGNRVYFTSINDDSLGGLTNNNANPPNVGQWGRVYYRSGSAGSFDYVEMRYGGSTGNNWAAIHITNASPQVSNCVLRDNARGLSSEGPNAHPRINYCSIYNNVEYGVFNAQSENWIDATNNWWGSSSGPYDPSPPGIDGSYNYGSGDQVSDYVIYNPWLSPFKYDVYLPFTRK